MKADSCPLNPEPMKQAVANKVNGLYSPPVATLLATGCGSPFKLAHSAAKSIARRFFSSVAMRHGGCARGTFVCAGSQLARSSTPAYSRHQSCGSDNGGSSSQVGALPMQFSLTQNPSVTSGKAAAHRAMAIAALHADSSLSVRLKRFNSHMAKARSLEAVGGAQ